MKLKSLVIADQQAAVNTFSGLVQIKCAWQFKKLNGVNPFVAKSNIVADSPSRGNSQDEGS